MRGLRSSGLAALVALWGGAASALGGGHEGGPASAGIVAEFLHSCVVPMVADAPLAPVLPALPGARNSGTETGRHWALSHGAVLSELRSSGGLEACRAMMPVGQPAPAMVVASVAQDFDAWAHRQASAHGLRPVAPCGGPLGDAMILLESEAPRGSGGYLKVMMLTEAETGLFLLTAAESGPAPHGC